MHKYLTELIGTFFLVLTIGLTVVGGVAMAPLAIGCSLMIMVYMGGHVSGAHYNPAVSLAVMMRGKLEPIEFIPYVVAQLLGALLAAWVVVLLVGQTFAPAPGAGVGTFASLLVEFLFTFALCLVVLNSATASKTEGNSFYGLAIGFTIVVAAFAGGPISGGAFNPAVGVGPILIDILLGDGSVSNLWLYLIGPGLGAMAASAVFKIQNPGD